MALKIKIDRDNKTLSGEQGKFTTDACQNALPPGQRWLEAGRLEEEEEVGEWTPWAKLDVALQSGRRRTVGKCGYAAPTDGQSFSLACFRLQG